MVGCRRYLRPVECESPIAVYVEQLAFRLQVRRRFDFRAVNGLQQPSWQVKGGHVGLTQLFDSFDDVDVSIVVVED